MRIGVDARPLLEPRGGLRRYLESILPELYLAASKVEWYLFLPRKSDIPTPLLPPGGRIVTVPGPTVTWMRTFWEEWLLPGALLRHKIDVLFSPYGAVPRKAPCPVIATIHDLYFRARPDTMPLRHRVYWNSVANRVHQATLILTPSESTRRDCLALLGLGADLVVVTHLGVSSAFRLSEAGEATASPFLDGPYLLTFGPWTPRKNLDALVEATRGLRDAAGQAVRLAVAGLARPRPLPDHVVILGELSDTDLAQAMRRAVLCCIPSFHEGFGLPAVEAMACGSPVVVSAGGAAPEISGGAALVVPSDDPITWRRAIEGLLGDPGERQRMSVAGVKRSRSFTWANTANLTYQALDFVSRRTGERSA